MANRAGTVALPSDLVDVTALLDAYFDVVPDLSDPVQRVAFGTSGHRGSSLKASFNEGHIAAITQAIVEYRSGQGITGPLFMGKDTHALSEPAQNTALEVLAANNVTVRIDARGAFTPTPAVSHAILAYNNAGNPDQADGIVITPSHNPPGGRRLQVQPSPRRTGRIRCNELDCRPGQRTARGRAERGAPHPLGAGAAGRRHRKL